MNGAARKRSSAHLAETKRPWARCFRELSLRRLRAPHVHNACLNKTRQEGTPACGWGTTYIVPRTLGHTWLNSDAGREQITRLWNRQKLIFQFKLFKRFVFFVISFIDKNQHSSALLFFIAPFLGGLDARGEHTSPTLTCQLGE